MKYRLRLRARPRGGAPRSPAPPPPPPPPASARPLCATAPPSRVPLAPTTPGREGRGELTDLLELHLGAGLLEALHGVVADGLGLGFEDGERQTGGHSVLRVLQAEGSERADGLDAGDLLGGVDFSDHDVEVGLLLGSLPPAPPAAPGAAIITPPEAEASTPNVSSIWDTSSDASRRVRPLRDSTISSVAAERGATGPRTGRAARQ